MNVRAHVRESGGFSAITRTITDLRVIGAACIIIFSTGASYATVKSRITVGHDSIWRAIAHHDTLISNVNTNISALRRESLSFNCYLSGYPGFFCDTIPRIAPNVQQTGTPRKSR